MKPKMIVTPEGMKRLIRIRKAISVVLDEISEPEIKNLIIHNPNGDYLMSEYTNVLVNLHTVVKHEMYKRKELENA